MSDSFGNQQEWDSLRTRVATLTKERDEVIYASIAESSMLRDRIQSLTKERDEWKHKHDTAMGQEVLNRIHSLEEGVKCAVEALQGLRDWQNGHIRSGWIAAMLKAEEALATLKPLIKEGVK